jgi:GNAT superfamily N-acetyltransferase
MADYEKAVFVEQVHAYLQPFSRYYPDIESWFRKVRAEAVGGRRRIFALRINGQLSGLAITKSGQKAKLCHFSLSPSARGLGLGRKLMTLAMRDLLTSGALAIHVTASDEVAEPYGGFFNRCGFDLSAYIRDCYRRGSDELIFAATPESLGSHLLFHVVGEEELHGDRVHSAIDQADPRFVPSRSETGFILVDALGRGFPQSDRRHLVNALTFGKDERSALPG